MDVQATPGAGVTQALGFLSWQRVVEKQRTVLKIQEIFVVDLCILLNARQILSKRWNF